MAHAPSIPCKPLRMNDFGIVDTPKFQISIYSTYSPISLNGKRLSRVVPSSLTSTVGDPEDHLPPSSRMPSSSRQDRWSSRLYPPIRAQWAIPQYPGHLHREILIFWQKSLWTIHTYHLVPFKLPKNVQRGPFQGLLVLKYFFQKISNFTNYALTPAF